MEATTTNFSVRTKMKTLKMFDSIISRQNLTRNRVIEDFMLRYIENNREETPNRYCLKGDLAKYKGVAAKIAKEDVLNDPRAKHALGYK